MLLVLNLPLAGVWARLLLIPRPYLYAAILFFAAIGAYAANGSSTDLWLLLIIGALGFLMRRFGLPVLPTIVGVILGPMFEYEFRQALQISNGSLKGLVNTPFSILIYVISALIVIVPIVIERRRAARGQAPLEVSHANFEGGN
ncbi:putative integral membrane protein (fragment) [Nostocoides australiense Ben110]|uniref:Putative integral membrane protein n=1 Tax=Nostocoides australiense Ben110 TaxID=1193182 RepID=W6JV99_9MICO